MKMSRANVEKCGGNNNNNNKNFTRAFRSPNTEEWYVTLPLDREKTITYAFAEMIKIAKNQV